MTVLEADEGKPGGVHTGTVTWSGGRALALAAEPEAKFFSSGHDLADVFVREGKAGVAARSERELRELSYLIIY